MEFIAYRLRIPGNSIRIALRREPDIGERDPELAHFLLKALPIHPGAFRRARDIASRRPQCANEKVAFPIADEFFLRLAKRQLRFTVIIRRRRMIRRPGRRRTRVIAVRLRAGEKIFWSNLGPRRQNYRLLDCRLERTRVALPRRLDARAHRRGRELFLRRGKTTASLRDEM